MIFKNLRSFIEFLDGKNDLVRIRAEVDPVLEITEIATRVVRQKGPALLFENVKGSSFPLLINMFGAERRIEWILGRSPFEVGWELARFADALLPPSFPKMWAKRSTIFRLLSMRPKRVSHPPVLFHRMEPADVRVLPILQCWPKDGGRFLTFPLVFTKSPIDGRQNVGVYRMQVFGPRETGMHWQIARGGGVHYQQAEEKKESLPLAVVAGADPHLMLSAVCPLPEGLDEMAFAGFLRGCRTPSFRATSSKLTLPAEAEFILEGRVPPQERRSEGPFGDHFGHYSQASPFPVFHVDRIFHRQHPVFPVAVVGKPPQEDQVMGDAVQEMFLPLLQLMHPELADLWAYSEAGFHNLLVASVHQRFDKEAVKTALWILGEGQLAMTKCVILVDPEVNVRRFPDVLKALRDHFDPAEDFTLLPSTSQDTLDFTGLKMNLGSKMILDATSAKTAPRPTKGVNMEAVKALDGRIQGARLIENALLVCQVQSGGRLVLEKLLASKLVDEVPLVAGVSPDVPLDDPTLLLWGLFTRFDCARDTFFREVAIKGGHPVYQGPLAIDATWKEGYPEPLTMDDDVMKKVDRRWKEYGLSY
ncbi:MAG: UbiD family decarboxylase [Elusimicrobia bacterium]|nr:UbiD family decarboxylase [Candidatus Obscuribacterium magneticum]